MSKQTSSDQQTAVHNTFESLSSLYAINGLKRSELGSLGIEKIKKDLLSENS